MITNQANIEQRGDGVKVIISTIGQRGPQGPPGEGSYAFDTLQEAQDKWASFSQEEKDNLDGKTFVVKDENAEYKWDTGQTGGTNFVRYFSRIPVKSKLEFEQGSIAGPSGEFIPSSQRARSFRFELKDGVDYEFGSLSDGYEVLATFREDSTGVRTNISNAAVNIKGDSSSAVAFYMVVRKEVGGTITTYEAEHIEAEAEYGITNDYLWGYLRETFKTKGELSKIPIKSKLEFEQGSIAGSTGEFIPATNRARSKRFELIDGVDYEFNLLSDDFEVLGTFREDSTGTVIGIPNAVTTIRGDSDSAVAFYVLVNKEGGGLISPDEAEDIEAEAEYSITNDSLHLFIQQKNNKVLAYAQDVLAYAQETRNYLEEKQSELVYEIVELNQENGIFKDNLQTIENNLASLSLEKEVGDSAVLSLKKDDVKLILNIHKRENDGYVDFNDVFLPNVKTDFSDLRVLDDSGRVLNHKILFKGNIDILKDSRLPGGLIYTNSEGVVFGKRDNAVKKSYDNMKTWVEELTVFSDIALTFVVFIDNQDAIYVADSDGKLWKSSPPYDTKSLSNDWTALIGENVTILPHSMTQHPDGDLFFGVYQASFNARIYKSSDYGGTWQEVYHNTEYQHVHNMSVDIHSEPVAIYAGVDGSYPKIGGILKSIDKGLTWVNLRDLNPNIPAATDYGVIYSDPSGYRLLGGETSITGGYSIIKTSDDLNFRGVLPSGKGIYFIEKINGVLFAGGISGQDYRTADIFVSYDEGETWVTAYTTSEVTSRGASDGYRYMSSGMYAGADQEQVIAGFQGRIDNGARIYAGGDNYFASILVEIPGGVQSITVESGYLLSLEKPIYNNSKLTDMELYMPLNENSNVIKEHISGEIYSGDFEWYNTGKRLGSIYPHIVSPTDRHSLRVDTGLDLKRDLDLSSGGFTISFWFYKAGDVFDINLIEWEDVSITLRDSIIKIGSQSRYIFKRNRYTADKIDLVFDAEGYLTTYFNGLEDRSTDFSFSDIQFMSGQAKFFTVNEGGDPIYFQHFSIIKRAITAEESKQSYYDKLYDNFETL